MVGNVVVTSPCQWTVSAACESVAGHWMCLTARMNTLKVAAPTKSRRNGLRLKGLGIVVSIAIAAIAIYALTHTLKSIDTNEVFQVIRRTDTSLIALAAVLVIISYASLTFYDLLALRTIGRTEMPYRTAALASFTSYPIAHGIGAARAFTVDPVAGAFAGIAMGLNAVATPIMVPLILPWLIR